MPIGFRYTGTLYIKISYPISGTDEYKAPDKRKISAIHAVVHKVAWAAVKKKYVKINEQWQLKA